MTPHPFAIGYHVWTVRAGVWSCGRCDQVLREWADLAGRVHVNQVAPPKGWSSVQSVLCSYRPRRNYVVERDAAGMPKSLGWVGDF